MIVKMNGIKISSGYGAMESFRNAPHTGIDLPMEVGTVLQTIKDGIVTKVFDGSGKIGKGVAIKTDDGTTHIFGHMDAVNVEPGQHLHAGDIIGLSGNTGFSTGPHLHFAQQMPDGTFIDPTPLAGAITGNADNTGIMQGVWEWIKNRGATDQYNPDISGNPGFFWEWIGNGIGDAFANLGHWFIFHLPDIMGYGAIIAAICIILGAMIGKGGMIKPLAIYAAALILALCLLA